LRQKIDLQGERDLRPIGVTIILPVDEDRAASANLSIEFGLKDAAMKRRTVRQVRESLEL
jgi:hypothetical protein